MYKTVLKCSTVQQKSTTYMLLQIQSQYVNYQYHDDNTYQHTPPVCSQPDTLNMHLQYMHTTSWVEYIITSTECVYSLC